MNNTARSAEGSNTIIFCNKEHEAFYDQYLAQCRYNDAYHQALIYCLGISRDTRSHIDDIYDFEEGMVNPKCMLKGWQTSGSQKIIRLAFNLYNNGVPTLYNYRKKDDQINELRCYTPEDLFCCSYAPYFWRAIKLRYPDYCN